MKKLLHSLQNKDFSINKFYLLNSLFYMHIGFIGATYVLFFYNFGLSKFSTNILSSIFAITVFITEIPTGAYADIFGTRKTLLFSGVFLMASMALFLAGNNMAVFLIAQMLWGVSFAFESGALDAWMVNNSKLKGAELDNIFARSRKINNLLSIGGGFAGGMLANLSLRWPWALSVVTSILYIALVYRYVNVTEESTSEVKKGFDLTQGINSIKSITKKSVKYCFKNTVVRYIILFNVIITFSFSPVFVYWSPYMNSLSGSGIWILGWIWVITKAANFVGNSILERIPKTNNNRLQILGGAVLCISAVIIIASVAKNFIVVLAMFILFEIFIEIVQPLQSSYINDHIPDSERATILSFNSMIGRSSNFLSLLIMGYIGDKVSMAFTWLLAGIILLSSILVLVCLNKQRVNSSNLDTVQQ